MHQHLSMSTVAFRLPRTPTPSVRILILLAGLGLTLVSTTACSSSSDEQTAPSSTSDIPAEISPTEPTPTPEPTPAPRGADEPEPPASPSPIPSAPPTEDVDPQVLFDAVDAFWSTYIEVGDNKRAFAPRSVRRTLEAVATGDALDRLFLVFQTNAAAGNYITGEIESSLTVLSSDAISAEVRDCYDDATGLYRIRNYRRLGRC